MNRPELHDVLRRWRALTAERDPEPILVGESYVLQLEQLVPFYGSGTDELHLAFNFIFLHADLDADAAAPGRRGDGGAAAAGRVAGLHGLQPRRRAPGHAAGRAATSAQARVALLMLLTLRGTPFLYYGDEIGLTDVPLDPAARARPGPAPHGRPGAQPRPVPHADAVERRAGRRLHRRRRDRTWLPIGDTAAHNVAAQREDPGSVLHLVRDLIALRRERADLRGGAYETLPAPGGRVGVAARRRHAGGAQPVRRRGRARARGHGAGRHRPRARRRGRDRLAAARPVGGRGAGRRLVSVEGLEPLLAEEGWPYASTPPVEPGDPGRFHALFGRDSLICSLQVLPERPDVARATLRALAALQGRVEHPGHARGAGQDRPRVPPAPAGRLQGGRLARRGRVPLLRDRRRDLVVPDRARRAGRRRAGARARRRLARGRRRGSSGALEAGGGLVRHAQGTWGALSQQGWRDAIDPVSQERPGLGHPAPGRDAARAAAGRRRQPGGGARGAARAGGAVGRAALGGAGGGSCASASARSAPRCWRSSRTGRAVPGAGSQLGWLLWADALEGDAREAAAERLCAAGRADRLRPAHAEQRVAGVRAAATTTAARSGRSTRGWAGAACAPPAARPRPSASAPACSSALRRLGRAPELYAVTRDGALEPVAARQPRPGVDGRRALGARARVGRAARRSSRRPPGSANGGWVGRWSALEGAGGTRKVRQGHIYRPTSVPSVVCLTPGSQPTAPAPSLPYPAAVRSRRAVSDRRTPQRASTSSSWRPGRAFTRTSSPRLVRSTR